MSKHLLRRGGIAVPILASLMVVLSAYAGSASTTRTASSNLKIKTGGVLNVGTPYDPGQLNPVLQPNDIVASAVAKMIMDPLFNLQVVNGITTTTPGLALSFTTNTVHDVFTVQLRQGVKFTDGEKFTSAAVVDQFRLEMNPATASTALPLVSGISSVVAKGPYTVVFNLADRWATFPADILAWTSSDIGAPNAEASEGLVGFGQHPIGTGQYEFSSWTPGTVLTLVRNPHYWGPKPLLSQINFRPISNEVSRLEAMESGQLNLMVSTTPSTVPLARAAGEVISPQVGPQSYTLQFNTMVGPTADVNVRNALAYGMDRSAISQLVFGNYNPPSDGPYPSNSPYMEGIKYPQYNLATAQAWMAKYTGPRPIPITMINGVTPANIEEGQILQQDWAPLGVKLTVLALSSAAMLNDEITHNFNVSWNPIPSFRSPGFGLLQLLGAGGSNNWTQYSNPTVNHDLSAARSSVSPTAQITDIRAALKQTVTDEPMAFVIRSEGTFIYTKAVHGLTHDPLSVTTLDLSKVWVG